MGKSEEQLKAEIVQQIPQHAWEVLMKEIEDSYLNSVKQALAPPGGTNPLGSDERLYNCGGAQELANLNMRLNKLRTAK